MLWFTCCSVFSAGLCSNDLPCALCHIHEEASTGVATPGCLRDITPAVLPQDNRRDLAWILWLLLPMLPGDLFDSNVVRMDIYGNVICWFLWLANWEEAKQGLLARMKLAFHIDHTLAASRGGLSTLKNLQLLQYGANVLKGNLLQVPPSHPSKHTPIHPTCPPHHSASMFVCSWIMLLMLNLLK
jgi:hypothetical protein